MVATPPQTDTYSTALDIFDRTHPLRVDVDENLKVTLAGGSIEIGTVDQGTGGASPWLIKGTVSVSNFPLASASDGTTTTVNVGTSSTVVLSLNGNRKGYTIFNPSGVVYILLGSGTVTTTSFTMRLGQYGFLSGDAYIGQIKAVRASGSGDVYVTELV